jgi:lipoprotein-anchoring transpeptidase ErfK/SrfK
MNTPAEQSQKTIQIDLALQIVETFAGVELVHSFECLSGDTDHPTDPGAYKIMRKHHPYRSHAYNVQMDYAMFFTLDGKALHQYHGLVPLRVLRAFRNGVGNWFGSHGCIRLAEADAQILYGWAGVGTTVKVI